MNTLKKNRVLSHCVPLLTGMLLFTTLIGCSKQELSAPSITTVQNSVVVAVPSEPTVGFDPCLGWGRFGNPLIQSRLVYFDASQQLQYDIATSYHMSEDGLTWTFYLRDDIYFSDGVQLTAKDVAFTFDTAKTSGANFDLTALEAMRVVSDFEVEFILSSPQFPFLYTIAQTGIVPAHAYSSSYGENPVGSGAFMLTQWDKGQQVILSTNPYYYGTAPSMTQVTLLFMSTDSALAGGRIGHVDVAITTPYFVSDINDMTLHCFTSIDNRGITLPVNPEDNAVTSDLAIRRALSYGIDRDILVDHSLNGYGTPAFSECDGMPWSHSEIAIDFDFDFALTLLEEGGWLPNSQGLREKDGVLAQFTLLYNAGDSVRQALAFSVAQQGKELGILIDTEGTNWVDIEQRMDKHAVLMGFGAESPMETYLLYHSSNAKQDYYNPEGYESEKTDFYLEQAFGATSEEEAFSFFQTVQWDGETGVSSLGDVPFLWLVNVDHLYYIRDGLSVGTQKIHPHGHDYPILSNLEQWTWLDG